MQVRLAILVLLVLCVTPVWASETKDIKFPLKNADSVTFSHDVHLPKYNNNCKVCHNAIFNLKSRHHFTMAEMEKTKGCGACHTGVKAFSVTDEKSCTNCHRGKPRSVVYKVKSVGNPVFSHEIHLVKMKGQCNACHGKIVIAKEGHVTMAQMEKGKLCGACHNGKKAFTVAGNCDHCHKGLKPHDIGFKPKGITPVTFSHRLHTEAYHCHECHTSRFPFKAGVTHHTMGEMAAGKGCGGCHNGDTAFSVNTPVCARCHTGFKPEIITFKTEGGEAKFSHPFHLEMFKCADCHTKVFALKAGAKHYTMSDMEKGKSCGTCHNGKDAFAVTGDCEKCHKN